MPSLMEVMCLLVLPAKFDNVAMMNDLIVLTQRRDWQIASWMNQITNGSF